MKRILFIISVFLTLSASVGAQVRIRDVFKQMPDSILPYLSQANRLDFLDFLDSSMKAEVTNLLDGKSEMTALTNDSLSIRLNGVTRLDMLLVDASSLVRPDSVMQVVYMIKTYQIAGNQDEHSVSCFTTSWTPLLPDQFAVTDKKKAAMLANLGRPSSPYFYDKVKNN